MKRIGSSRVLAGVGVLGVGVLGGGAMAGCVSEAEIREVRDAARALADQLEGPRAESLRASVAEADQILTATDHQRIEEVAGRLAPLVPAPMQAPLILGVGLAASVVRAGQLKRALASVARGIEKAKQEDEGFREAFSRSVPTFRATQTPAAARIIDETTRNQTMLRLPV